MFVEVKPHKPLKACQTRWLSLEACVNRLIEQYNAPLSYFHSTDDDTAAVRRITIVLEKTITKAYLLFLSNALPVINYFNKCMQQKAPLLHVFMQEIQGLVQKLLLRFMKSDYVCKLATISEASLDDEAQYPPLDEVFVGHSTSQYLDEALEDSLSTSEVRKFQKTIRSWWYTCSKEAIKRLPLQNLFLARLKWLQPGLQQYNLVNQVLLAADSLPQVIKDNEKSALQEEYMDFCTLPMPSDVKAIKEVDAYWHAVSQVKDLSDSDLRYPLLTRFVKAILIIPHGNADTERLFSHIGLNKTKHRNSLSIDTLNSLLTIQFNVPQKCYEFKPTKELVSKCKNAISELKQST